MAKISLALKYRPKTFDDLSEQAAIKDILNYQLDTTTFQHAYLFTGPAGTGKTTSARIFANQINKGKGSPIEIDAASNSGVDNIRNIIDESKKKPLDAEYKIFIIDECHSLSNGAWQAMLKILEEPPKFSIFILCTTDPQKIPATILSRVQRFQFNKISLDGIFNRLIHILSTELRDGDCLNSDEMEALHYIAKLSNGGMREAITTLDKCLSYTTDLTLDNVLTVLGVESYDTFFKLYDGLLNRELTTIHIVEDVYNSGKDIKQFFKDFSKFLLNCEKFSIFKDINCTTIPASYEVNLRDIKSQDVLDQIQFVMNMNNILKWDTDILTTCENMILIYCREGAEE